MKKIIHLSDLHVGCGGFKKRFSMVVDNLVFEKSDKASQYVIVVTGDLVDNANNKNSYSKVKIGLDKLKKSGFKHILVVPGNHDYGTGDKGNSKFVKLFKDAFFGEERNYPKTDIIDEIAFIGLDSIAEELHWYDELFAEGELGKKQLQRLGSILQESKICSCRKRVIYLHHHPFEWRPLHQLKDSHVLKEVLMQAIQTGISIDAILFGHNHEGKAHNGQWGIPRCYDAGTTTLKPRPKFLRRTPWFKIRSSPRVIDLGREVYCDYVLPLL